jgi:pyridoxamine 5'-phosphate oxidase
MQARTLTRDALDADPFRQFAAWYEHARDEGVPYPEACAIATCGLDARPSVRMVLLKDFDDDGFAFATNYESRKGRELAENPHAALVFYWQLQGRQVRIEGRVERVPPAESDAFFLSRPRASRISALASEQSRPVASREELLDRVRRLEEELAGREVERPARWGAYRLFPDMIEFWQHADNRLHSRFVYRRIDDDWRIEILQP